MLNLDADGGALVSPWFRTARPTRPGSNRDAEVTVAGSAGGDLIVAVDGEPLGGVEDLIAAVDAKQPGDEVGSPWSRGRPADGHGRARRPPARHRVGTRSADRAPADVAADQACRTDLPTCGR